MTATTSKDAEDYRRKVDEAFPIGQPLTVLPPDMVQTQGAAAAQGALAYARDELGAAVRQLPRTLVEALARLQLDLPIVRKGETAKVEKDGRYLYSYAYADLTDVSEAILPRLAALGLSWLCLPTMAQLSGEAGYRFLLHYRLSHVGGESVEGFWPLPDRADPQAVGSTITYARRYALCAVTGVAPGGDDEDGRKAKEASAPQERATEASRADLTDTDKAALVAALKASGGPGQEDTEPTPLGRLVELWRQVQVAEAANRPSPLGGDPEKPERLTWAEAFGHHLAARIENVNTPEEWRELQAEIKAAGGGDVLWWPHEGKKPGDRFTNRGRHIADVQAATVAKLEEAIAAAVTVEEIDRVTLRVGEAHEAYKIHGEHPTRLHALARQRRTKLVQRAAPAEDMSEPRVVDEEGDVQQEASEPEPDDAPWPQAAEPPAARGPMYRTIRASIWKGGPLAAESDRILGMFERGELTGDEHAELEGILRARPEPGEHRDSVTFLLWQVEMATEGDQLDGVRDFVNAQRERGKISPADQRRIHGKISARRLELAGGPRR